MKVLLQYGAVVDSESLKLAKLLGRNVFLLQMEKANTMTTLVSVKVVSRLGRKSQCFLRWFPFDLMKLVSQMAFS